MQILHHDQIQRKVKRLAIQIFEQHFEEKELILAGINHAGMDFARRLASALEQLATGTHITLTNLQLNPANPIESPITLDLPTKQLTGKTVIIVDDVANTGRTIFYAMRPVMETLPKGVEVAVLVDRTHKAFPIKVDYVGLSLATTLREHIEVQLGDPEAEAVYLR